MNNSMEKTQWMYERKFGVFFHHLESLINNKNNIKAMAGNSCCAEFPTIG